MKDLISREAVLQSIDKIIANLRYKAGDNRVANLAVNLVQNTRDFIAVVPAVDAVEVAHGRWEMTADGAAKCTACGRKMKPSQYGYPHCGLCGARMDGE